MAIPIEQFKNISSLSFKVKAYSFQELMHQPLACSQMEFMITYNRPENSTEPPIRIRDSCREIDDSLNYTIDFTNNSHIYLSNLQYVRIDAKYNGQPLVIPGTRLYLLYSGQSYYFTGLAVTPQWFTSLELEFGYFYKTQISPFYKNVLNNLWPLSGNTTVPYFTFSEPYFEQQIEDFSNHSVRIFFKYTNDNNPFQRAIIRPLTVLDGVSKVGGYFAIFGLLKVCLFMYNRKSFESSLKKRFREKLAETQNGDDGLHTNLINMDPAEVDDKLVQETLSYEMVMKLAFMQHKKA